MSDISTTRCSPVQMRKILVMVETMRRAGMEFVPVPVLNDQDRDKLMSIMAERLGAIAAFAEAQERIGYNPA